MRELRQNLSKYLDRIKRGERLDRLVAAGRVTQLATDLLADDRSGRLVGPPVRTPGV